jgi:hypothetical protein
MLLRLVLLFTLGALLGGCETLRNTTVASDFDDRSTAYQKVIRWDGLGGTAVLFAAEEVREQFAEKVVAAQGVRVTDYRISRVECKPDQGVATVVMEIDYYREPSITVRTVEDVQQWRYGQENGKKGWRLQSVPPEFP